MVPENPLRKYSVVDVCCTDQIGRQFLVEMQFTWNADFISRVFFNGAKAFVRQGKKAEQYKDLKPVYSLKAELLAYEYFWDMTMRDASILRAGREAEAKIRVEGREEKAMRLVKLMKENGIKDDKIAACTGIPLSEIIKIKENF